MGLLDDRRVLGRSGLKVGRLGVSGGYGAPAAAFELAFERGCNYFYHGSMVKPGMTQAIKNLCAKGKREELVVVAQVYTRWMWQFRRSFEKLLRTTGLAYADVLLLGWYNSPPAKRIVDTALELRSKGLVRHLAVSGHHRPMFAEIAGTHPLDIFHLRYNAAHRGAEQEIFSRLPAGSDKRPGTVVYTATCWASLIDQRRMPAGVKAPQASDCYRFVLSNDSADVCMTGPKTLSQMEAALAGVAQGPLSEDELAWMRRVGDHVHRQNPFLPAFLARGSRR